MSDSTQNEPGESDDACDAVDHEHCEGCGKCDDNDLVDEYCDEAETNVTVCKMCQTKGGCC
jgi:hypothetical protein